MRTKLLTLEARTREGQESQRERERERETEQRRDPMEFRFYKI